MRTSNLLALAALATLTAASAPDVRACGPYMMSPRVFILASSHGRTIAIEAPDARTDVALTRTWPNRYDATAIASLPTLARPFGLTLLSEHGTSKKTASDRDVLMRDNWRARDQVIGLELANVEVGQFEIAVAGNHTGLAWARVESLSPDGYRITDTVTATRAWDEGAHHFVTTLHDPAGNVVGSAPGVPFGMLTADGQTHLIVNDDGVAHALLVY